MMKQAHDPTFFSKHGEDARFPSIDTHVMYSTVVQEILTINRATENVEQVIDDGLEMERKRQQGKKGRASSFEERSFEIMHQNFYQCSDRLLANRMVYQEQVEEPVLKDDGEGHEAEAEEAEEEAEEEEVEEEEQDEANDHHEEDHKKDEERSIRCVCVCVVYVYVSVCGRVGCIKCIFGQ
jgi:hypothetical protein